MSFEAVGQQTRGTFLFDGCYRVRGGLTFADRSAWGLQERYHPSASGVSVARRHELGTSHLTSRKPTESFRPFLHHAQQLIHQASKHDRKFSCAHDVAIDNSLRVRIANRRQTSAPQWMRRFQARCGQQVITLVVGTETLYVTGARSRGKNGP